MKTYYEVTSLSRRIDRLIFERMCKPRRWPRTRVIVNAGCLSLWLRPRFWPGYRRHRSYLELWVLGLTLVMSLPVWAGGGR